MRKLVSNLLSPQHLHLTLQIQDSRQKKVKLKKCQPTFTKTQSRESIKTLHFDHKGFVLHM